MSYHIDKEGVIQANKHFYFKRHISKILIIHILKFEANISVITPPWPTRKSFIYYSPFQSVQFGVSTTSTLFTNPVMKLCWWQNTPSYGLDRCRYLPSQRQTSNYGLMLITYPMQSLRVVGIQSPGPPVNGEVHSNLPVNSEKNNISASKLRLPNRCFISLVHDVNRKEKIGNNNPGVGQLSGHSLHFKSTFLLEE